MHLLMGELIYRLLALNVVFNVGFDVLTPQITEIQLPTVVESVIYSGITPFVPVCLL